MGKSDIPINMYKASVRKKNNCGQEITGWITASGEISQNAFDGHFSIP